MGTTPGRPTVSHRRSVGIGSAAFLVALLLGLTFVALRAPSERTTASSTDASSADGAATQTPGRVLWSADGSAPLEDEWASFATDDVCWTRGPAITAPGRVSARIHVSRRIRPANTAASYEFQLVDEDDCSGERAELGQGNPAKPGMADRQFRRGDDVWIAYRFLVPSRAVPVVSTWQCLGQLKAAGPGGPVLCPSLVDDRLGLWRMRSTAQRSVGLESLWEAPLPVVKDRWVAYLYHVVFDPDPNVGHLEFWADIADGAGLQRRVSARSIPTMKVRPDGAPAPVHARVGIYRDAAATGEARIHFAGYAVATTRRAAEQAAFGEVTTP